MSEMIGKCPSLTLDALERSTVIRDTHFLAFPGHPVTFHGNNYFDGTWLYDPKMPKNNRLELLSVFLVHLESKGRIALEPDKSKLVLMSKICRRLTCPSAIANFRGC